MGRFNARYRQRNFGIHEHEKMPLDFGKIQDYDGERGFGSVSRTISGRPSERIFFHITKIRYKYRDLARRLDNGYSSEIGFWYNIETTDKGKQVSELWMTAEEIPSAQRDELISYIESIWRNTQTNISPRLDSLTLKLVDQAHRDQLYQEQADRIRQQREAEIEKARLEAEKQQQEESERARRDAEKQALLQSLKKKKAFFLMNQMANRAKVVPSNL
ncbi:MAG: hypothetical protein AB1589_30465 [Cyanobacteriota bacterium]